MSLNLYEQFVLDEIEGGLREDKFRRRFRRIERSHLFIERPLLFACVVWGVAAFFTAALFTVLALVIGSVLALAAITLALVVAPSLAAALYLAKHR